MSAPQRPYRPGPYDRRNHAVYERPEVVRRYDDWCLHPAEAIILVTHRDDIVGKRVLDLGCGAGRTTATLRHLTPHYVGLDYSEPMIARCRQRFPGLRFVHGDVRALGAFGAGDFDFAWFTFNGIDTLDHPGRLAALREVHRVLADGGLFAFSSHNRRYEGLGEGPTLRFSLDPMAQARRLYEYARQLRNHRRYRGEERDEAEYAILNDRGHDFALLHYYIDKHAQRRQLEHAGFELISVLGDEGEPHPLDADDRSSRFLRYVARKRPA